MMLSSTDNIIGDSVKVYFLNVLVNFEGFQARRTMVEEEVSHMNACHPQIWARTTLIRHRSQFFSEKKNENEKCDKDSRKLIYITLTNEKFMFVVTGVRYNWVNLCTRMTN
jgi:hypothetical protein